MHHPSDLHPSQRTATLSHTAVNTKIEPEIVANSDNGMQTEIEGKLEFIHATVSNINETIIDTAENTEIKPKTVEYSNMVFYGGVVFFPVNKTENSLKLVETRPPNTTNGACRSMDTFNMMSEQMGGAHEECGEQHEVHGFSECKTLHQWTESGPHSGEVVSCGL